MLWFICHFRRFLTEYVYCLLVKYSSKLYDQDRRCKVMKKFLATIELPGGVTLPAVAAKSMPELLDIEKILEDEDSIHKMVCTCHCTFIHWASALTVTFNISVIYSTFSAYFALNVGCVVIAPYPWSFSNLDHYKNWGDMKFSGTRWKYIAREFVMLFQFVLLIFTLAHLFNVFFTPSPYPIRVCEYTIRGTNWHHCTEICNAFPMRTTNLHSSKNCNVT